MTTDPVRLGISRCLLGEKVRWDGRDKRHRVVAEVLAGHVRWVPVCPEVEIGLGVPREPVHLVGAPDTTRLVGVTTGEDHSAAMQRWAAARIGELADRGLDGYLLKASSPSCGLVGVPVHDRAGRVSATAGRGLFADALTRHLPDLPIAEEGCLDDPTACDHFLERVFVRHRWRRLATSQPTPDDLVGFHADHRLALLVHDPAADRQLRRLLTGEDDPRALRDRYGRRLAAAFARPAARRGHRVVVRRIAGMLDGSERAGLVSLVGSYAAGQVGLEVVRDRLRRLAEQGHLPPSVARQSYLSPYPPVLEPTGV